MVIESNRREGGRGDFETMEEVERNAGEMGHCGFNDIAVRDDGNVLIGMPLAHAFEFANNSCLNV